MLIYIYRSSFKKKEVLARQSELDSLKKFRKQCSVVLFQIIIALLKNSDDPSECDTIIPKESPAADQTKMNLKSKLNLVLVVVLIYIHRDRC